MKYAGFWPRFAAALVDFVVLLAPIVLLLWLSSTSIAVAIMCAVPLGLLYWFYSFHFHAATGQTLGKRVLGIRVVRLDASRIGVRESFRRSVVDLFFALMRITVALWSLSVITPFEFYDVRPFFLWQHLDQLTPRVFQWAEIGSHIWVWSELITLLLNGRKRAIHDFIAGTVVIDERVRNGS